jgi:hypothetical protein
MFHIILGSDCPPPVDDFTWDWRGRPGDRIPSMPGEVFWSLRRGMLNEGVDLMGSGGLVSSAHTDQDIEQTVAAFRATLAAMARESAFKPQPRP